MRTRSTIFRVLTILLLAFVGIAATILFLLTRAISVGNDGSVFVAPGTSVAAAVDSVHRRNPLPTPWLVRLAARLSSRLSHRHLQAGWYMFHQGDTQLDVIQALFSGHRRPTIRITIPEGKTYREAASIMKRTAEIDSVRFVRWCENDSVCGRYMAQASSMEGYLLPNTYDVFWREEPSRIGDKMARAFRKAWNEKAEGLLASSGMTYHEALTLASIIQAEAADDDEMPRIAGVYANRLKRNMKLEADPTVQYGLGIRRRVLYRDLEASHAYNTYRVEGLPPGPINNPGMAAVLAALQPEEHGYLFFVARGDGSGLHNFARTGSEHQKNVQLYRANR